ncbi:MAG: hypothetical protein JXD23_16530 [Spirochaetales bacterium]|nr:hypothetical protein [Spirochaetales bacterium]
MKVAGTEQEETGVEMTAAGLEPTAKDSEEDVAYAFRTDAGVTMKLASPVFPMSFVDSVLSCTETTSAFDDFDFCVR